MRCLIVHNLRSGFGSKAIFDFERALIFAGDEIVLHALGDDESATDALRDAADGCTHGAAESCPARQAPRRSSRVGPGQRTSCTPQTES